MPIPASRRPLLKPLSFAREPRTNATRWVRLLHTVTCTVGHVLPHAPSRLCLSRPCSLSSRGPAPPPGLCLPLLSDSHFQQLCARMPQREGHHCPDPCNVPASSVYFLSRICHCLSLWSFFPGVFGFFLLYWLSSPPACGCLEDRDS